jgi:hypothetical protein
MARSCGRASRGRRRQWPAAPPRTPGPTSGELGCCTAPLLHCPLTHRPPTLPLRPGSGLRPPRAFRFLTPGEKKQRLKWRGHRTEGLRRKLARRDSKIKKLRAKLGEALSGNDHQDLSRVMEKVDGERQKEFAAEEERTGKTPFAKTLWDVRPLPSFTRSRCRRPPRWPPCRPPHRPRSRCPAADRGGGGGGTGGRRTSCETTRSPGRRPRCAGTRRRYTVACGCTRCTAPCPGRCPLAWGLTAHATPQRLNRGGWEELASLFALPSGRTLRAYRNSERKGGFDARSIADFAAQALQGAEQGGKPTWWDMSGALSHDAMSLRKGLWWNNRTHELVGFEGAQPRPHASLCATLPGLWADWWSTNRRDVRGRGRRR